MKKILAAITVIILFIVVFTSCTSTQKCAAYGERQRYQMERR